MKESSSLEYHLINKAVMLELEKSPFCNQHLQPAPVIIGAGNHH